MKQLKYGFILTPFLSNFVEFEIDYFVVIFGPFKASFPHKIQQNWKVEEFR